MSKFFIRHRVNRLDQLSSLGSDEGAEIDLRSDLSVSGGIHLAHDPWSRGDDFDLWLSTYSENKRKAPLILNTKEDGLEDLVVERLRKHSVENYFFLDTSLPTLVRQSIVKGRRNFALRYSIYEPVNSLAPLAAAVDWLWVDCFNGIPVDVEPLLPWIGRVKICLVSPELQGGGYQQLEPFSALFKIADAVCTKNPSAWKNFLAG